MRFRRDMELNQKQKELAEAMAGIVAGKTAAELKIGRAHV